MILPSFDCDWISRYPDESESVFVGGLFTIRVQSIRIIETAQNFEPILKALYLFDGIISDNVEWTKKEISEITE